jgi:hypothetical protein
MGLDTYYSKAHGGWIHITVKLMGLDTYYSKAHGVGYILHICNNNSRAKCRRTLEFEWRFIIKSNGNEG